MLVVIDELKIDDYSNLGQHFLMVDCGQAGSSVLTRVVTVFHQNHQSLDHNLARIWTRRGARRSINLNPQRLMTNIQIWFQGLYLRSHLGLGLDSESLFVVGLLYWSYDRSLTFVFDQNYQIISSTMHSSMF